MQIFDATSLPEDYSSHLSQKMNLNPNHFNAESEPQKHLSISSKINSNKNGSISDTESTSAVSTNTSTKNTVISQRTNNISTLQNDRQKPPLQRAHSSIIEQAPGHEQHKGPTSSKITTPIDKLLVGRGDGVGSSSSSSSNGSTDSVASNEVFFKKIL